MSETAAILMQKAAQCFDQAKSEKNPVAAATLAEIGTQYVRQARELRMSAAQATKDQ